MGIPLKGILIPVVIWQNVSMVSMVYTNGIMEVFLNTFAKGLAKFLPITVCDGIINL